MKLLFLIISITVVFHACKKDEKINPYDLIPEVKDTSGTNGQIPDPASIAGLHQRIFKPTCANSGCHDGTFEPDFRTIESSYNTLVSQPVIKNNPQGTFTSRVVPGDDNASILIARLITDIDGQSGIMPLSVDPGSDWNEKSTEHINHIRAWINGGAKDVFGNSPQSSNLPPQARGIFITESGSMTPLERNVQTGSMEIPQGVAAIDIYLALTDDITEASNLTYLKTKVSSSMNNFEGLPELDLTPIANTTEIGYDGNPVAFNFRFTLSISEITDAAPRFIRAYIQDESDAPTEIPSTQSAEYIKRYYSFQVEE